MEKLEELHEFVCKKHEEAKSRMIKCLEEDKPERQYSYWLGATNYLASVVYEINGLLNSESSQDVSNEQD